MMVLSHSPKKAVPDVPSLSSLVEYLKSKLITICCLFSEDCDMAFIKRPKPPIVIIIWDPDDDPVYDPVLEPVTK